MTGIESSTFRNDAHIQRYYGHARWYGRYRLLEQGTDLA
ncbi:MAG TPA: hypothetical protein DEB17_04015 [Chlorobaculum sp.]|uniref:Uncharacterized protein n=1 Tax=Chlorobaculum tepidum (strain ATCC 49652 / DSM 12025 / NBRC 103806 / TLS) TaxID=194439 RepID=Q8KE07_CHLTE|nr:hypothetical protein CT0886 [Chlorobaculum tepidum TLS]HBU23152.1 hypothetical protein [Chlorobaculum sp.]